MATNPKSDLPPQEEIQKLDNLTTIPGVSEALEQWLRESLKVYTFADLAKLTAQKIRARGKQTGEVLSIEELEPVLARAKELADAASAESALPARAKPEKAAPPAKPAKEWNDFANFVICFERKTACGKEEKRTKIERSTGIEHMETGERASWPGIETDEACRWMLERLGDEIKTTKEKSIEPETPQTVSPSAPELAVSEQASLEITQIHLFQPPANNHPQELLTQNRTFNGFIKSNIPSSVTVEFRLSGVDVAEVTKRAGEYSVAFSAQDLFTSDVQSLGVSRLGFLQENQLTYTAWLAPFTIPAGVYSLKIVATIRDTKPIWASAEVPLLQVA